jgi:hypothetical protein
LLDKQSPTNDNGAKGMMKLIRVERSAEVEVNLGNPRPRQFPQLIYTSAIDGASVVKKQGEFFLVEATDVDAVLALLAEANPGHEVQVYTLEKTGICPASALVMKKVSDSGVLPEF